MEAIFDSYEIEIMALSQVLDNVKEFIDTFDMSEYEDAEPCFRKGFQRALDRIGEIVNV